MCHRSDPLAAINIMRWPESQHKAVRRRPSEAPNLVSREASGGRNYRFGTIRWPRLQKAIARVTRRCTYAYELHEYMDLTDATTVVTGSDFILFCVASALSH